MLMALGWSGWGVQYRKILTWTVTSAVCLGVSPSPHQHTLTRPCLWYYTTIVQIIRYNPSSTNVSRNTEYIEGYEQMIA